MKLLQVQRSGKKEVQIIFEVGFLLKEIGYLDDSEILFQGMIGVVTQSDVPYVALATIEIQRGNFAKAQQLCEEGLNINPDSLYARVHRAEALLMQNNLEAVQTEVQEIMKANPTSPYSDMAGALLEVCNMARELSYED